MGAPLQLESVVVPKFLKTAGDVSIGRVSSQMVDAWLTKEKLHFDRVVLHEMFAEADYKGEGSLTASLLTAAIAGEQTSASFQSEISVSSPRKMCIFVI